MLLTLTALARAQDPVDLDGDGKKEAIAVVAREGEAGQVKVGKHAIECGYEALCEVEVIDIDAQDRLQELVVADQGPRGDRWVEIYRYDAKKGLVKLPLVDAAGEAGGAARVEASGNGILLATEHAYRYYERVQKYLPKDGRLVLVPQPFWSVDQEVAVEVSVPLLHDIGGSGVVANLAPGSKARVVAESAASPGWFLVRSTTGLVGWIDLQGLATASPSLGGVFFAG